MKWAGECIFSDLSYSSVAFWPHSELGILQNIETTWIVIGVVILAGVGIMVSVANAGTKQNIEIDQE